MPRKPRVKQTPPPAGEFPTVEPALWPLVVPMADLVPDPANARKHNERNLATVAASLARFRQRTPIVVNRRNMVIEKGNGTFAAAQSLGWTHLAVVFVEDDPTTQAGYAIADNRTSELAEWDNAALDATLRALQESDFNIGEIGFTTEELDALIASATAGDAEDDAADGEADADQDDAEPDAGGADETGSLTEKFQVLVDCTDEEQQAALLERLDSEGYSCRALIS